MKRTVVALGALCITACGPPSGPLAIMNDARVKQARDEARRQGALCGFGCADKDSSDTCDAEEFELETDITGTWRFANCQTTASTTGNTPAACGGEITFQRLDKNRLEQMN